MSDKKLPSFKDNLPDWYQEVVERAELAEHCKRSHCAPR